MGREAGTLLRRVRRADFLDSGCRGMARSFGFERGKVDVSLAVANDRLQPAVKYCGDETLVIADGYGCREQIAQASDRRALHLAQVMALATRADALPARARPEQRIVEHRERGLAASRTRTLATLGAVGLGAAPWALSRHHDLQEIRMKAKVLD